MRPGGKSNGGSPFFETPNLSFEGRVRNVASPHGTRPLGREDPDSCSRSRSSLGGMILGSRLFALKTTRDTAARRAIVN